MADRPSRSQGRQPLYVARQLGHSRAMLLSSSAHLLDEYAGREPIDADTEIPSVRKEMFGRGFGKRAPER